MKGVKSNMAEAKKQYRLLGADHEFYLSDEPGTLGGHDKLKIYGRLDCPSALNWLKKGMYKEHRVFFKDEAIAIAAGYRPCARCLPQKYKAWKAAQEAGEVWKSEDRLKLLNLAADLEGGTQ